MFLAGYFNELYYNPMHTKYACVLNECRPRMLSWDSIAARSLETLDELQLSSTDGSLCVDSDSWSPVVHSSTARLTLHLPHQLSLLSACTLLPILWQQQYAMHRHLKSHALLMVHSKRLVTTAKHAAETVILLKLLETNSRTTTLGCEFCFDTEKQATQSAFSLLPCTAFLISTQNIIVTYLSLCILPTF